MVAVAALVAVTPLAGAEDKKPSEQSRQHEQRQAPPPRGHAVPRDRQRQEPQHRAEPRPERPERRDADRRQYDDRRQHVYPHQDSGHAVPRFPSQPGRHTDAELRHPHPDADHFWRQRHFGYHYFFNFDVYGSFWFPYRYPYAPRLFEFRYFNGRRFGPNSQLWCQDDDGDDFACYWPFLDEPPQGCGWYRVPTHRMLTDPDPYDGIDDERWEYDGWREVYICFD